MVPFQRLQATGLLLAFCFGALSACATQPASGATTAVAPGLIMFEPGRGTCGLEEASLSIFDEFELIVQACPSKELVYIYDLRQLESPPIEVKPNIARGAVLGVFVASGADGRRVFLLAERGYSDTGRRSGLIVDPETGESHRWDLETLARDWNVYILAGGDAGVADSACVVLRVAQQGGFSRAYITTTEMLETSPLSLMSLGTPIVLRPGQQVIDCRRYGRIGSIITANIREADGREVIEFMESRFEESRGRYAPLEGAQSVFSSVYDVNPGFRGESRMAVMVGARGGIARQTSREELAIVSANRPGRTLRVPPNLEWLAFHPDELEGLAQATFSEGKQSQIVHVQCRGNSCDEIASFSSVSMPFSSMQQPWALLNPQSRSCGWWIFVAEAFVYTKSGRQYAMGPGVYRVECGGGGL